MYVVRLQYKDSSEPMYADQSVILERKRVKDEGMTKGFSMSKQKAYELFNLLISRHSDTYGSYTDAKSLDYICIVELSHYEPYPEYQVIEYREFK